MAKLFQFIEVLFSTLLLHGQKVLAQDQKNPFDFSCWEKTCNSWNVKTFNFVYFALNQTENLSLSWKREKRESWSNLTFRKWNWTPTNLCFTLYQIHFRKFSKKCFTFEQVQVYYSPQRYLFNFSHLKGLYIYLKLEYY